MQNFEKLGAFYLGRQFDLAKDTARPELLLYDSKDLTTHAVCVGMTGSGKTGLCLSLLEEAAIDGIPAIAIDPKGDIGNLLLTFPELAPADFQPWVDAGEASRQGQTAKQYASSVAETWRKGLADWGQDGERIARLRSAVDMAIYTPGSNAGLPLTVLRSLAPPPQAVIDDRDAFRERILSCVSGLLALVGIAADPVKSREHILLSNILDAAWREGRSLQMADLIHEIQSPPFDKVGVMDLEMFFPERERFELSLQINNLLASPGFASWMEGEPLDVNRLLFTEEGRPRLSIISIAHLSESERMFFVTLLLNEVVTWMRTQAGTSSLRALLYMDEVFGYFPPTANPPSKQPMLTLMKQARAFGVGVVLATQNPVDIDYKGLSNAGTWFLGRLQTERDKARVLDGLEGAAVSTGSGFNRQHMEATLAALGSRVFLMNNVHDDEPVVFETRWAMSYLRGPLTRQHIVELMKDRKASAAATAQVAQQARRAALDKSEQPANDRPVLPPGISERFLPPDSRPAPQESVVYRPALFATARTHYANARLKLDSWKDVALVSIVADDASGDVWADATLFADGKAPDFDNEPREGARFSNLTSRLSRPKSYSGWKTKLKSHIYSSLPITILKCPTLKTASHADESEGDFRARLSQLAHEHRDLQTEKLRKKYAPQLARLKERIRKAEERVDREKSQLSQQTFQSAISFGSSILGALFGRKLASRTNVGRAATSMRSAGRVQRERGDVSRAQENVESLEEKFADLEEEFQEELDELEDKTAVDQLEIETVEVKPRKSDIDPSEVTLVWTPWRVDANGIAEPAFQIGDSSI